MPPQHAWFEAEEAELAGHNLDTARMGIEKCVHVHKHNPRVRASVGRDGVNPPIPPTFNTTYHTNYRFNARRKFRGAIKAVIATNRMKFLLSPPEEDDDSNTHHHIHPPSA